MGGNNPERAYRRFVEQGLASKPEDPFRGAVGGWLLGSSRFLERIRALVTPPKHPEHVPMARRVLSLDYPVVLEAVARHFGISAERFGTQRSGLISRDLAAWLARANAGNAARALRGIWFDPPRQRPQPDSSRRESACELAEPPRRNHTDPYRPCENRKPGLTPRSPPQRSVPPSRKPKTGPDPAKPP